MFLFRLFFLGVKKSNMCKHNINSCDRQCCDDKSFDAKNPPSNKKNE